MINIKRLFAKGILATLAFCPQVSAADGFTSTEVLTWEIEAQDSYFLTSISMIAMLTAQIDSHGHIADCLNDWYWTETGINQQGNDKIREVMLGLGGYHPQAVILAVIEKNCGALNSN